MGPLVPLQVLESVTPPELLDAVQMLDLYGIDDTLLNDVRPEMHWRNARLSQHMGCVLKECLSVTYWQPVATGVACKDLCALTLIHTPVAVACLPEQIDLTGWTQKRQIPQGCELMAVSGSTPEPPCLRMMTHSTEVGTRLCS